MKSSREEVQGTNRGGDDGAGVTPDLSYGYCKKEDNIYQVYGMGEKSKGEYMAYCTHEMIHNKVAF